MYQLRPFIHYDAPRNAGVAPSDDQQPNGLSSNRPMSSQGRQDMSSSRGRQDITSFGQFPPNASADIHAMHHQSGVNIPFGSPAVGGTEVPTSFPRDAIQPPFFHQGAPPSFSNTNFPPTMPSMPPTFQMPVQSTFTHHNDNVGDVMPNIEMRDPPNRQFHQPPRFHPPRDRFENGQYSEESSQYENYGEVPQKPPKRIDSWDHFHYVPTDNYADHDAEDDTFDETKSVYDKYQREKDQSLIENWLKKHGKVKSAPLPLFRKSSHTASTNYQVHDVQQAFHQSIVLLAKLQQQCRSLESVMSSADLQVWKAEVNLSEEYKDKCLEIHEYLSNEDMLRQIHCRLRRRKKKREWLKKQRKEENEERQLEREHRQLINQQLEEWRQKMAQLAEEEKQKVELKKSADATLSSVRKKIADAKKTQEFLKAFEKLRSVRRAAAINQCRYSSDVYDAHFEKKMGDLTALMERQQAVYETEEKTLKVMLETAEEETRERDKEIKQQKELAKEKRMERLGKEKLFGKNVTLSNDHDLHSFLMYYSQANESVDSLLQIRHEWDMHLVVPSVPAGGRVPDGWVIPAEPSSDIWASALKE